MQITKQCTGCMACYSVCPVGAINIIQNEEGFFVPKIDNEKCIKCGLCCSTCPQNKGEILKNQPCDYCFAAQATEDECKKSSSGAVFPLLANYILEQGGYVCGAAFREDFKVVEHIIIDKKSDLHKLRSSKYVQSFVGNILKEIKILLEKDKLVLFSGTPCQCAGLKTFLKKDYKNLYIIDLLCHGTPSPMVWEKYLTEISSGEKVESVNFRDKNYGWYPTLSIKCDNGTSFCGMNFENLYLSAFLQNLTLNEACYFCKYTDTARVGDITLGDFWGIENFDKCIKNIKNGVSLVLVNNSKGQELFDKINLQMLKKRSIIDAKPGNIVLDYSSFKHSKRNIFFKNLSVKPILENLKESLEHKYDGIIANFWWTNNNYGAILSAYAIQQYLLSQGFDFNLLNLIPQNKISDSSKKFAQDYLKLTHKIFKIEELSELNNCTNNFVVGTDQVFRYKYIGKILFPLYTLAFTKYNKRRIAFSASFGKDKFDEANFFEKYVFKKCLQRFDAISVREKSGVKLCKKYFGIKVEDILDPVLLLDKSFWHNLADSANVKTENKLVSYILDENDEIRKIYNFLEKKYKVKVEKLAYSEISPEAFLSSIKNAKYFITDSFHGVCFALIFNKKVICLTNEKRGNSRFENLKLKFDISPLFYQGFQDIVNRENELFKTFDYQHFVSVIENERIKTNAWLKNAFNSTKKYSLFTNINENFAKFLLTIKQKDFEDKLEEYNLLIRFNKVVKKYKKQKIIFWGASLFLKKFITKYKIKNSNILGIVDKNTNLQGTNIDAYEIFAPEKLAELKPDVVICSIRNNHEYIYPIVKEFMEENYPNIELLPDIFESKR